MSKGSLVQNIKLKLDFWAVVKIVVILILLLFLVYPFSSLIFRSFLSEDGAALTLQNYADFFTLPYYFRTLTNSLSVSITTTVISFLMSIYTYQELCLV